MSKELKDYYIALSITIFVILPLVVWGLEKLSDRNKALMARRTPEPVMFVDCGYKENWGGMVVEVWSNDCSYNKKEVTPTPDPNICREIWKNGEPVGFAGNCDLPTNR